jgi:lipopolysaccharide transport system ATP-binding protein
MSDIVIKAEGLGKSYIIGHNAPREQYVTLRDVATKSIKGAFKKTTDLFKGNAIIAGDVMEEFWALKDLDFEINRGDAVGIIGRNGAGKSTLLKVLSRITEPSAGKAIIKGRVASLLEVGTGFHPELSGRDNIFLNGAVLGMSRGEIRSKFDEIVDFAGVEKFLDTPVKKYSSGMYVRLAFAVAAYLEPEILIVDEVLAVGDAEFQKKCLGKMNDVSKSQGRTVIFVSHNMAAVSALCTKGIFLNQGRISYSGPSESAIKKYFEKPVEIDNKAYLSDPSLRRGNGEVRFTKILINNGAPEIKVSEDVIISFSAIANKSVEKVYFSLLVNGGNDGSLITSISLYPITENFVKAGQEISFTVNIPKNTFRPGIYPLYLWLGKRGDMASENYPYDLIENIFTINYIDGNNAKEFYYNPLQAAGVFNSGMQINHISV